MHAGAMHNGLAFYQVPHAGAAASTCPCIVGCTEHWELSGLGGSIHPLWHAGRCRMQVHVLCEFQDCIWGLACLCQGQSPRGSHPSKGALPQ